MSLHKGVTEGERSKLDDVVVAILEESSKTQEEKKWRDALQEVRHGSTQGMTLSMR